jgi:hypothetical protein
MPEPEPKQVDRRAGWLLRGRQGGLTDGADGHLLQVSRILVSRPVEGAGAAAYVVARKEKS